MGDSNKIQFVAKKQSDSTQYCHIASDISTINSQYCKMTAYVKFYRAGTVQ